MTHKKCSCVFKILEPIFLIIDLTTFVTVRSFHHQKKLWQLVTTFVTNLLADGFRRVFWWLQTSAVRMRCRSRAYHVKVTRTSRGRRFSISQKLYARKHTATFCHSVAAHAHTSQSERGWAALSKLRVLRYLPVSSDFLAWFWSRTPVLECSIVFVLSAVSNTNAVMGYDYRYLRLIMHWFCG